MKSFDEIKDSIICKLSNTENNQDILKDRPHITMEDISASFAIVIGERKGERASIPITNDMMKDMGVDVNTLMETAKSNMVEQDYSFKSMRDVLIDSMFPEGVPENDPMIDFMLPPADGVQMYVLTNNCNINGACEVLNTKAMDEIADKLDGDFVVLPSSVHETIILPLDENMNSQELNSMIKEINSSVLNLKDKLSDHVFQYDSEDHELVRMDKMQERQQEKAESKEKSVKAAVKVDSPKKSLIDRISNKKEEAAKKEASRPQPSKQNKRDAVALT
ncbi:MAG: hypothetical protein IJ167_00085 [Lachnospiraceae bacterium]|nr:hypothetical protein [Lachnospiraceae bacterium]